MHKHIVSVLAAAACALLPLAAPAAPLAPDPHPAETFDVGMLHVERFGSGAPIVLIPGLGSGEWTWNGVIPHLAAHHDVYAVTLAGFAGRPAAGDISFAAFERDLTSLIDTRHLAKPVLVGHSLGGTLALAYGETHGDRIRGIVAADGLPILPGLDRASAEQRAAAARGAYAGIASQTPAQMLAFEQRYFASIGVSDAALADQLATLAAHSSPPAVAAWMQADLGADLRPGLATIPVPVLEIAPYSPTEGDPAAPMHYTEAQKGDYYRALLAGTPHLDVVTIAPSRHFVMFDQPERFQAALDGFLARLNP